MVHLCAFQSAMAHGLKNTVCETVPQLLCVSISPTDPICPCVPMCPSHNVDGSSTRGLPCPLLNNFFCMQLVQLPLIDRSHFFFIIHQPCMYLFSEGLMQMVHAMLSKPFQDGGFHQRLLEIQAAKKHLFARVSSLIERLTDSGKEPACF